MYGAALASHTLSSFPSLWEPNYTSIGEQKPWLAALFSFISELLSLCGSLWIISISVSQSLIFSSNININQSIFNFTHS